jgi:protein required for attachment to host cells
MILANGTIVALVDGAHVRLFRNQGREPEIRLVPEPDPSLEVTNVGSGARHRSSTANPDRSRLREDNFAAAVAGYLNEQALSGRIDRLVIVADARTLGEMRRHFHGALSERLSGQIEKNLTGFPVSEIEDAFRAA